ncbi:MAG: hypothetical protein IJA32_11130 [Lachnospiraceae bacterium]|nr:hypothetical protein [Lachnospiraceae bacterium]
MTGKDVLEALNYLEDDMIESAVEDVLKKKGGRGNLKKWSVAAAVILVCIAGGTMMKAYGLTAKLEKFISDDETKGYELKVYPVEAFTGEVQEVEGIIKKQMKEFSVYSSQAPESWFRYFDSSKEAMDYLGFEPLKRPDWDLEEKSVVLYVDGNKDGKFVSVSTEIDYEEDGIQMQYFSTVYTEYSKEEGLRTTNVEYESLAWLLNAKIEDITANTGEEIITATSKSFYVTESMKQGMVIKFGTLQSGYTNMEGYLVEEGIIYRMNISYPEGGEERAEELLHQWFEQF